MLRLQSRSGRTDLAFVGLHGALLDSRSLLPIGQVLCERGEGLLLDLAGHGVCRDRLPPSGRFDPASLAEELADRPQLLAWLNALPPERPLLLLGHSLGALTALALAQREPFEDRLDHVLLLDPPLLLDLAAAGQGELLFDLGGATGALAARGGAPEDPASPEAVQGIAVFFLSWFRDLCAARDGQQPLRWLRQQAARRPCHLVYGLQQQVRLSEQGGRLDFGSLVAAHHLPDDLPLLRLHPIADAGHRLDTSPAVLQLIASLLPHLACRSRPDRR